MITLQLAAVLLAWSSAAAWAQDVAVPVRPVTIRDVRFSGAGCLAGDAIGSFDDSRTRATLIFSSNIASARTFGFLKEVEWLRQNGLALGGSLENAIVIGDTGVLNALRFEDEFVRHKILDVVGDLALVGRPIVGHVVAHRAGHALHTQLAAEILNDQEAWCLVEAPSAVPEGAFDTVGAPGVARAH